MKVLGEQVCDRHRNRLRERGQAVNDVGNPAAAERLGRVRSRLPLGRTVVEPIRGARWAVHDPIFSFDAYSPKVPCTTAGACYWLWPAGSRLRGVAPTGRQIDRLAGQTQNVLHDRRRLRSIQPCASPCLFTYHLLGLSVFATTA